MTLTSIIRNLEAQLKDAEKLTRQYDSHASAIRRKLEEAASVVGESLGIGSIAKAPKAKEVRKGRRKGKMSAAGRARIAAAQKKRWAAFHAKSKGKGKKGGQTAVKRAKRKMSAEGRARIVAAQKARWAKVKAGK